ncbi:hypothetical protein THAOC_31799 [Thalassiosira oceanica]|uniref:Uncharacterized protein n=1 Tax=Thalassiosira oceanica TaxID=159749 RepID=K0R7D2_THAOC|nr:hypothetical protein THAOC_31799 [Thalassiosira oceanica]|eukprot:EJK49333.1 hypothetical protein THAOC_31799 [Thalassiosira oceanica]
MSPPSSLQQSDNNLLNNEEYSDMPGELGNEMIEICTMAMDKFVAKRDYEGASTLIKNTLDKKFGPSFQVVVGEGYAFDVSCQRSYLLHIYYGKVGILVYKSI